MFYTLQLNAKLQPLDRGDLDDLLDEFLSEEDLGSTSGGGTLMSKEGEIEYCDIEIELKDTPYAVEKLLQKIEEIGVPKGSKLYNKDFSQEVGVLEGLGLYINGTDLPEEVYETTDINVVFDTISEALKDILVVTSYYEGNKETALYFYVRGSFIEAKECIKDFIDSYPLCERCRIVQIA
nr:hypothetical protein [uncultured Capnocytophaga sp.]